MRISYNTQAMRANNSLNKADNLVSQSIQKLSSGLKVSAAKDNPSGYAMSKRMNMQIEGLSLATQNANDGISIIETADGALSEIHDMLQRMNELAVKAAHGILTDEDRKMIEDEIKQLQDEITRVANTTEFNGQPLLDGTFDLKGYTDNLDVKVNYYSDQVPAQEYTITSLTADFDADGNIEWDPGATPPVGPNVVLGGEFPAGAKVTKVDNNRITIGVDDFEITLSINNPPAGGGNVTYAPLKVDCTGIGAMDMQIGANEGQILGIRIPAVTLENMGIEKVDVSTEDGARDAIDRIKNAIIYISSSRSRLGAYENRLEHTVNSLSITEENLTKAYSGIVDTDMAEEMTEYTTRQVVTQAATSVLAQANERPSQALQLLQ